MSNQVSERQPTGENKRKPKRPKDKKRIKANEDEVSAEQPTGEGEDKPKKSKGKKRIKIKRKRKAKKANGEPSNSDLPNVVNRPVDEVEKTKKTIFERLKQLFERNSPFKFIKTFSFGRKVSAKHKSDFKEESFRQTSFMYTNSNEPAQETYTQSLE